MEGGSFCKEGRGGENGDPRTSISRRLESSVHEVGDKYMCCPCVVIRILSDADQLKCF